MIAELTRAEIDVLLREQLVGRIGCHAGAATYVVPVIYAYDGEALYVASLEGRKLRMMRENPRVCFEVDEYERGRGWRSAILEARFEELHGAEAERALALLAARFQGGGVRRPRTEGGSAACFRLVVLAASGRASAN